MSAKQEVERGNWSDLQPQPAHHHAYRLPPRHEKPLSPPAHPQQHRQYQPPPPPHPPQQQQQPAQQQQQQQHNQEQQHHHHHKQQQQQQQQQSPLPPLPPQQQSVVTLPRPPPPPPPPYAQPHHPVQPVQPAQPVQPPASQPAPAWHCDEATARLRTEEDRHTHEAFVHKAHKIAERLRGLGERRSHLENELAAVNATAAMTEKELEAAQEQYHAAMAKLQHERAMEDRHKWMDPSRRTGNHDMGSHTQPPAAGGWTSINGARPRTHDDDEEPPADPGNLLGKGYRSVEESDANGRMRLPGVANGMDIDDLDQGLAYRPRKADEPRPLKPKQQRHSLPGFAAVNRGSPKREVPLESKARSPSGRRSLPAARGHAAPAEPEEPVDETEINQETFILKHNGKMYTEPAMYYGVPLERISPDHPYWDPNWQPLEDIIRPQLEKWQEKLTVLRQTPDAVRHTVFLANRQVNRGQSVIDFLKDGEFHPYQYVGKEMMEKFYKTFTNYDTMFRLINIHEELKKFDLDLKPLEWLRQRMYEVSQAQGDKFSLSKYTHDLYHDPKLKQLREKHGFGNIGRPSGYKIGEKNPDKGKGKAKRESTSGTRRRNRRSIGQVDMDEPLMMEQQHYYHMHHQAHALAQGEFLDPQTPRLKRPRIDAPSMAFETERTPEPVVDDLECDGYTSTDSFSAGRISHLDFRVYQVKSPALTTSTEVTQYWTWDQDKELFEHQVLRDVHPKVTWGYYQKSANFDIKLDELVQIQYAVEDQKVIVSTKDQARPVVMAHLKRERTKRRFLAFVKKRGVKIVKTNAALIETAWNDMKSNDTLPGESESPSS